MTEKEACGARTVFWPDIEAIDAVCFLPRGHQPADRHEDEALGEWSESDLMTTHPEPTPTPPEES
jgi:hypothetical protein